MTSIFAQTDKYIAFDSVLYQEQVEKITKSAINQFDKNIKSYTYFSLTFILIGIIATVLFLLFFSFLAQSALVALAFSGLFLLLFSFFVLRLYLQTKKEENIITLKERFLNRCKLILKYQEGIAEHHLALADAASKFAMSLNLREYTYYRPPSYLRFLSPYLETLSCFLHWSDVHHMQKTLLESAIKEQVQAVKCEPTSLELHASLANAYVMLASLYMDPNKTNIDTQDRWIPKEKTSEEMRREFRINSNKAIEEFKILNEFAPNDTWVHTQLAYSYRDLQMPQEEIKEYETILQLNPEDKETLFKLGKLYFQQGENAKGLQVYESLKTTHIRKAEALIQLYGA